MSFWNEQTIYHLFKTWAWLRVTMSFNFSVVQTEWLMQSTAFTKSHGLEGVQAVQSSLPPSKPLKSKTESQAKCWSETAADRQTERWLMTVHATYIYCRSETKCWASSALLLLALCVLNTGQNLAVKWKPLTISLSITTFNRSSCKHSRFWDSCDSWPLTCTSCQDTAWPFFYK